MDWKKLTSIEELEELIVNSEKIPALIFKHSYRCGTSSMVLDRLERNWKGEDNEIIVPYFLDVIRYRAVSNEVESRFGVMHESPQALVIKNGKCVYNESHSGIGYGDIMDVASGLL
jgi:bacillithiol system protein YtxJ